MCLGVIRLEPELVFVKAESLIIGSARSEHVGEVQICVFVFGVKLDRASEFGLCIVQPEIDEISIAKAVMSAMIVRSKAHGPFQNANGFEGGFDLNVEE